MVSNILYAVGGILFTLLVLMVLNNNVSKKLVYRSNLGWLFGLMSVAAFVVFMIFFVPAIHIVVAHLQLWVWLALGASVLCLIIAMIIAKYYRNHYEPEEEA